MKIPLDVLSESQVAHQQIQRYRKSSSVTLIFIVVFGGFAIRAFPNLLGVTDSHPELSATETFWMLAISSVVVAFHYYQRRSMKTKADDAQKRIFLLRKEYGTAIDLK